MMGHAGGAAGTVWMSGGSSAVVVSGSVGVVVTGVLVTGVTDLATVGEEVRFRRGAFLEAFVLILRGRGLRLLERRGVKSSAGGSVEVFASNSSVGGGAFA